MFNVSELYSMLQVLRANFHQVDCNELAFTSMKDKKKRSWTLQSRFR